MVCETVEVEACEEVEQEVCNNEEKCRTLYKNVCEDDECMQKLVNECMESGKTVFILAWVVWRSEKEKFLQKIQFLSFSLCLSWRDG